MLSKKRSGRLASYKEFVSLADSEKTQRFYSLKNLSSVMGGDTFKEWIREEFRHLGFHDEIPESRILAPSAQEIYSQKRQGEISRCYLKLLLT